MEIDGWDISRLLTPKEAAERLNIRAVRLSEWADRGKVVTVVTLGGQRRYSAEQVEAIRTGRIRIPRYRPPSASEPATTREDPR